MKQFLIGLISIVAIWAIIFLIRGSSGLNASTKSGKKIYKKYCLPCHQADGSGVPQLYPPLKNTSYVLGDKSRLIRIVMNGFTDSLEINGEIYTNPMPSFGANLKDKEIADVLTYVRNSFGNHAGRISANQVRALRNKKSSASQ